MQNHQEQFLTWLNITFTSCNRAEIPAHSHLLTSPNHFLMDVSSKVSGGGQERCYTPPPNPQQLLNNKRLLVLPVGVVNDCLLYKADVLQLNYSSVSPMRLFVFQIRSEGKPSSQSLVQPAWVDHTSTFALVSVVHLSQGCLLNIILLMLHWHFTNDLGMPGRWCVYVISALTDRSWRIRSSGSSLATYWLPGQPGNIRYLSQK